MVCVEDGVCSGVLDSSCKSDPPLLSLDSSPEKYMFFLSKFLFYKAICILRLAVGFICV